MAFQPDTREEQIYNCLWNQESKFIVDGVEFREKIIERFDFEREQKCRKTAKKLYNLIK